METVILPRADHQLPTPNNLIWGSIVLWSVAVMINLIGVCVHSYVSMSVELAWLFRDRDDEIICLFENRRKYNKKTRAVKPYYR